MSASSSFFLLILSLSVSASRRACWMRACIASGDTSLDRPGSISAAGALCQSKRNWQTGAGLVSAAMEMVRDWKLEVRVVECWWKNASSRGVGADQ